MSSASFWTDDQPVQSACTVARMRRCGEDRDAEAGRLRPGDVEAEVLGRHARVPTVSGRRCR